MNTTRMLLLIVTVVLIVIVVILGRIQVSHAYNIHGASAHKWYFYEGVAVIGNRRHNTGGIGCGEERNAKTN